MTKIALPVLVLGIIALFSFSVTSQSSDAPPDLAALRAELTQQIAKSVDGIRADVQRLSDEAKANSENVAQTVMLRSDLLKLVQDAKSSSDKSAQILLEQIDALRADQVKFLKEAEAARDTAAQALREETAATQAKYITQIEDTLKASTNASAALSQRIDAIKKDIDDVKKTVDEDLQTTSNISPGFALLIALAALVLGPFLSFKFTENQLASIKQRASAEAAAAAEPKVAEPKVAETAASESTLAPSAPEAQPEANRRYGASERQEDPEKV